MGRFSALASFIPTEIAPAGPSSKAWLNFTQPTSINRDPTFYLRLTSDQARSGCLAVEPFLTDPRLCVGAGRHISPVADKNVPTG